MLILYLTIVVIGFCCASIVLLPELVKPPLRKTGQMPTPSILPPKSENINRLEKLESILDEKNRNITVLQKELRIFHAQIRDFDKIKTLLEAEIHHLKEQNRIFRSELGLPTVQATQNSLR